MGPEPVVAVPAPAVPTRSRSVGASAPPGRADEESVGGAEPPHPAGQAVSTASSTSASRKLASIRVGSRSVSLITSSGVPFSMNRPLRMP